MLVELEKYSLIPADYIVYKTFSLLFLDSNRHNKSQCCFHKIMSNKNPLQTV